MPDYDSILPHSVISFYHEGTRVGKQAFEKLSDKRYFDDDDKRVQITIWWNTYVINHPTFKSVLDRLTRKGFFNGCRGPPYTDYIRQFNKVYERFKCYSVYTEICKIGYGRKINSTYPWYLNEIKIPKATFTEDDKEEVVENQEKKPKSATEDDKEKVENHIMDIFKIAHRVGVVPTDFAKQRKYGPWIGVTHEERVAFAYINGLLGDQERRKAVKRLYDRKEYDEIHIMFHLSAIVCRTYPRHDK